MNDFRFALRTLARSPLFTIVAALALALGLGANTAIFSVVDGVLLRPLPYDQPERIAMVWNHWEGWPATWISEDEFWDFSRETRAFEHLGAFTSGGRNLTGDDHPERVATGFASAGVFPTLGIAPVLGRVYGAEEDRPGGARVAVRSYALWQRRFGGERDVVGRTIRLDDSSFTVIGIMPAGFQLPLDLTRTPMDLWLPLQLDPVNTGGRGGHYLNVVGRTKPGVSSEMADADVAAIARRMVERFPKQYSSAFGSRAVSVEREVLGKVRPALLILLGAVGFVLLIACANVANLLLARAESRQREIAVRMALGAGRARLVRQMLVESLVLFALGGVLAIALAFALVKGIAAIAPATIPRLASVTLDLPALGFALAISLITGLAFGLVPALHATASMHGGALTEGGRGASAGRRRQRVRRTLVVSEVALALVLVAGAGLLIRSFSRLRGVDAGFDPDRVLTMRLALPPAKYATSDAIRGFYRALVDRARALPGVRSAALVRVLPMTGELGDWSFQIEGRPTTGRESWYAGDWEVVTADYFDVMRIALREGRLPTDRDDERAPGVMIINETLARKAWPSGGAIGARVKMGGEAGEWRTVIGIVRDVRQIGLDAEPRTQIYLPHAQFPSPDRALREMALVMRTSGDPVSLATPARRAVAALDPNLPIASLRTMDDVLGSWAAERRLTMLMLSSFAAVALALAAVGIYGVMSYTVAQRTREMGIRIALGAEPRDVIRLVVRQGVALAAVGIVVGLLAALALTRLMRSMLFEVTSSDPLTFVAICAILVATALVACWIPARRATRVQPTEALRAEG
jgi:predicted permease